MSSLYPVIQPYKTEFLQVDKTHNISIKQYGNAEGAPVFFIAGGPGGGCDHRDARRFDPKRYRIILHDQRGSGDSTPPASLEDNTTQHLVADIEMIREHLGVEKAHVFGGSWGSTLSLAYAQAHPDRVKSLTLRGIFTLRRSELEFFYQEGTSWIFADAYDEYIKPIPEEERGDLISAFYKRLTSPDTSVRAEAARAWSLWEMSTSRLKVDTEYLKKADEGKFADAFARIEAHYFVNGGFMEEGALLKKENIDKIRHIPTTIVQGRYDVVCPFKTAWDLHKAFPEAKFIVIPDAGHSAMEEGTEKALVAATDEYASLS